MPAELTYDPFVEEMAGARCLYEVPKRWYAMKPFDARQIKASLPACPVSNCPALERKASSENQKEHLIHYFTTETRVYARGGAAAAEISLRDNPYGNSNEWLIAV